MASLRKAANCIGVSGNFSVLKDFYGYRTGAPKPLSLRTQIRLLQGAHIHLNLIQTADFAKDAMAIDAALQFTRDTYATVSMGVGRVKRYVTPPGWEVIDGHEDSQDLWNSFSVPNDGIDVFLVKLIVGGAVGHSPEPRGECDKDDKDDNGCTIEIEQNSSLGKTLAHEVGHFLGLRHVESPLNLMYETMDNVGRLDALQGKVMRLHCSVHAGCST